MVVFFKKKLRPGRLHGRVAWRGFGGITEEGIRIPVAAKCARRKPPSVEVKPTAGPRRRVDHSLKVLGRLRGSPSPGE